MYCTGYALRNTTKCLLTWPLLQLSINEEMTINLAIFKDCKESVCPFSSACDLYKRKCCQWKAILIICILSVIFCAPFLVSSMGYIRIIRILPVRVPHKSDIVRYLGTVNRNSSSSKLILYWTKYFRGKWNLSLRSCKPDFNCNFTTDRSRIREADGLLFNHDDIKARDLPEYRDPDQVWIFTAQEAPTNLFFDFGRYRHIFNWTMTYRTDSTVFYPYRAFKPSKTDLKINPFITTKKERFAFAAISNKFAFSKRYRIVKELKKMNPAIDLYGEDYDLVCENLHGACLSSTNSSKYSFMLALENSHCQDYVTEKFWDTVETGVIPVVHWLPGQKPHTIPDHSYINIYDFPSLREVNDYLIQVSENITLYNSYWEWRKNSRITYPGPCNLCDALHSYNRRQTVDLEAWLHTDTVCKPTSVSTCNSFLKLFKLGALILCHCYWMHYMFSQRRVFELHFGTGSKISMSSIKFVFFRSIGKTRWPSWPMIGRDIFDFSSETAERNSTKLNRKQYLKDFHQVCVFRADRKNKKNLNVHYPGR